jgi:hypothetical protein
MKPMKPQSLVASPTSGRSSGISAMVNSTCLLVFLGLALAVCGCKKKPEPQPTQAQPQPESAATPTSPAKAATPAAPATREANVMLNPVNPGDSEQAQQTQRKAVLMAIRTGMVPPPPALKLKGGEPATPEVLKAYNVMLIRAMPHYGESPETLDQLKLELIQKRRLLPKLPTAPPGRTIVYDSKNFLIRLDPP